MPRTKIRRKINSIFGFLSPLLLLFAPDANAQAIADQEHIREIFNEALKAGKSYDMLYALTTSIGQRLSGSAGAAAAVAWSSETMQAFDFDSVWLQPVMVPHWVRGQQESARIINSKKWGTMNLSICALGGSIGTGPEGITANLVEVKSFDELKRLDTKSLKGKIIFFNRPMDPTQINSFAAYGGAVDQRARGAVEAAKYGAVAVIVRSMGLNLEDYPHTGGMWYSQDAKQIPAVAISTKHAELLSKLLKEEKEVQVYMETHCETLPEVLSYNVIGELKGGEYKDEIISIGGHLDSWDLAQGAHDDGAGCVQAIEVLRILKAIGYKPKRTLRAVMFMNEENGLRGGTKYAELALKNKEKHIAAMESDMGGFTPRGFTMSASEKIKSQIKSWKPLFEPYGLTDFNQEGGGADIGPLAAQGVALIGFLPDSQRYFDYHHTPADKIEAVSKRELELGAASMTALVFLIDKNGLEK